ncbi:MAG: urease accessory protein UreD [Actinomycetota bacterium]|nr:urease accessory protein UreD [Actinomycetota bacterium]
MTYSVGDATVAPGMRAVARARAGLSDDGSVRMLDLRSEVPIALRFAGSLLTVVGSGGGPVGGDSVDLDLSLEPGVRLEVTSSAATVALPGPEWVEGAPSEMSVTVSVGPGGYLVWNPMAGVAASGCDHRTSYRVQLAPTSSLDWFDRVALGRFGEAPGKWTTAMSVEIDGRPLYRSELLVGAGSFCRGQAALGWVRIIGSILMVRPTWRSRPPPSTPLDGPGYMGEIQALAGPGMIATVMTADHPTLDAVLARVQASLGD